MLKTSLRKPAFVGLFGAFLYVLAAMLYPSIGASPFKTFIFIFFVPGTWVWKEVQQVLLILINRPFNQHPWWIIVGAAATGLIWSSTWLLVQIIGSFVQRRLHKKTV